MSQAGPVDSMAVLAGSGQHLSTAAGAERAVLERARSLLTRQSANQPPRGDGSNVVLTDVTGNAAVFGRVETSAASTTGAVYGLYEALLDRASDPLGLQSLTSPIQSGASLTDVATAILGFLEYNNPLRAQSTTTFVESLYINVLNRPADAGALLPMRAHWPRAPAQRR